MYSVFNMGLGMVLACDEASLSAVRQAAPDSLVVGQVVSRQGDPQVLFD